MEIHRLINELIEDKKKRTIKLLQRLVQEDSIRGNESKAQAIIIEKCRKLGLELDIWEISENDLNHHPFYRCDRKSFKGNPNVVGVLKGTGGGKSLLLNGHIDVVPEGNKKDWVHDPYSGFIEDGRLYGRGATDMKGGSAALLLAIEVIKEINIPLKGDVIFQSVIEEESGGTGTLAALIRGYKADAAIIPEPTNMKIFPKQQGSMWFRLRVKGKSAHGGTRYEGVNAIDKAYTVIHALQKLEKERNDRVDDPLYRNIPIPLPVNIGRIESGKWPSSVPDMAVIEGRIGVGPWETMRDVEEELILTISNLKTVDAWFLEHPAEVEWFGGRWQPGNLPSDHELVNTLSAHAKQVMGTEPVIEASPWGTDGGILSQGGDIPVVIFGPGTTEVAHDANEYIELERMYQTAEILALFIIDWCNQSR
ncbi:peptidase [Bacillus sp. NTK074B]|uniref:peptidase n=1 Tax=Bacillus sp. NTK074B TaxID=2802174 RepID=UPI001A8DA656|nr:peptidase [Bacillus sp. NTK074B]